MGNTMPRFESGVRTLSCSRSLLEWCLRRRVAFPAAHRRLVRTTNGVERRNKEIRQRTRVVSIFPNEASCLRLVRAILMEISEDWETGKNYLAFDAA